MFLLKKITFVLALVGVVSVGAVTKEDFESAHRRIERFDVHERFGISGAVDSVTRWEMLKFKDSILKSLGELASEEALEALLSSDDRSSYTEETARKFVQNCMTILRVNFTIKVESSLTHDLKTHFERMQDTIRDMFKQICAKHSFDPSDFAVERPSLGADRRGTSVSTVEATAAGSEAVDVAAIGAYLHRHSAYRAYSA